MITLTRTSYWFGFEYYLILNMLYAWFQVLFNTQNVL